jgi:hypothetical protein
MPKSLSLLTKFPSRSMFVGLMSPCATELGLLLCRNESAEQISEMMSVLASHAEVVLRPCPRGGPQSYHLA